MSAVPQNKARIADRKRRVLLAFGWKCSSCGLEGANPAVYDIHHVDGKLDTGDSFGKMKTRDESEFEAWLSGMKDRGTLLCANCHRIAHHPEE